MIMSVWAQGLIGITMESQDPTWHQSVLPGTVSLPPNSSRHMLGGKGITHNHINKQGTMGTRGNTSIVSSYCTYTAIMGRAWERLRLLRYKVVFDPFFFLNTLTNLNLVGDIYFKKGVVEARVVVCKHSTFLGGWKGDQIY